MQAFIWHYYLLKSNYESFQKAGLWEPLGLAPDPPTSREWMRKKTQSITLHPCQRNAITPVSLSQSRSLSRSSLSPPPQTTRSFPLSLSRSLTLPLLRLISEVHWNPGKLFQHLRSVRVLWRTFWMCWCVQTVTLPADMALHHTICQRLQVNSATQA